MFGVLIGKGVCCNMSREWLCEREAGEEGSGGAREFSPPASFAPLARRAGDRFAGRI
jgi:hypothetical protein